MKYIDVDKLIERLEDMKQAEYENCGGVNSKTGALQEVQELIASLQQEQTPTEREIAEAHRYAEMIRERDKARIQQEQSEVGLEKFTEKIKTFQGRYKYPEIVSIKGAMAFMARMFYQYPNVARQWYDSLPKATMD